MSIENRLTMTTFNGVSTGEVAGSATAEQFPSVVCKLVKIIALSNNAGTVYIGGAGVTVADGTTDTTTGFPIVPGAETPWLPISNVDLLYRICDNAGDDCVYIALN